MLGSWLNPFSSDSTTVTSGQVMQALATAQSHPKPERAVIPYILFQISCDRGLDITVPVATALRIVRRPGCVCDSVLSTLIFVTCPGKSDEGVRLRDEIADELIKRLGGRVRLVKGKVSGIVGQIGRGNDCYVGCAFAGIEKLCVALFTQSYGMCTTKDLVPAMQNAEA